MRTRVLQPHSGFRGRPSTVYPYLKGSKIKHYVARHEEGAVHAADRYCKASGRMALAICTSGPGATNFVTGLYTARADSIPLIAITGMVVLEGFHMEDSWNSDLGTTRRKSESLNRRRDDIQGYILPPL
ncbi:MAG: thiamine pyrophosphate-binding protein [Bryobacteraceae bacterium]